MSEQNFSISDLSKAMDVTPRSVWSYEEQGLLSPLELSKSAFIRIKI